MPALVCEPLLDWADHLFTTRGWTLGRTAPQPGGDGWAEVADAMGVAADRLRRLRQVHGAAVVIAEQARNPLPDADIILSTQPDLAVAVQAADCVPLLLVDRRTGAVAAAHAGWRGLAARVPGETVQAMARAFGSRPEDLLAAIGPAIGPCCYEVGEDVRQAMAEQRSAPATPPTGLRRRGPAASGCSTRGRRRAGSLPRREFQPVRSSPRSCARRATRMRSAPIAATDRPRAALPRRSSLESGVKAQGRAGPERSRPYFPAAASMASLAKRSACLLASRRTCS